MQHSAASDLGLHCLPTTLLWVSRLQWVRHTHNLIRVCWEIYIEWTCKDSQIGQGKLWSYGQAWIQILHWTEKTMIIWTCKDSQLLHWTETTMIIWTCKYSQILHWTGKILIIWTGKDWQILHWTGKTLFIWTCKDSQVLHWTGKTDHMDRQGFTFFTGRGRLIIYMGKNSQILCWSCGQARIQRFFTGQGRLLFYGQVRIHRFFTGQGRLWSYG